MDKPLKVAVLYGGRSVEHDVSVKSAANICAHLAEIGCVVMPMGITREGAWYLQEYGTGQSADSFPPEIDTRRAIGIQPGCGMVLKQEQSPLDIDICFPVTHGTGGEDGLLQGLLELARLPYVGSGPAASSTGMHKRLAKLVAGETGAQTVAGLTVTKGDLQFLLDRPAVQSLHLKALLEETDPTQSAADRFTRAVTDRLGMSLIVKPEDGGSSVGAIAIPRCDTASLLCALTESGTYTDTLLIETLITDMIEIECAVITDASAVIASDPGMVVDPLRSEEEFLLTYRQKYLGTQCAHMTVPAPIGASVRKKTVRSAISISEAVGVEGFARVDFFCNPKTGEIWFNEINTLPGMTGNSHFPILAASAGYGWDRLLMTLLEEGFAAYRRRESLTRIRRD